MYCSHTPNFTTVMLVLKFSLRSRCVVAASAPGRPRWCSQGRRWARWCSGTWGSTPVTTTVWRSGTTSGHSATPHSPLVSQSQTEVILSQQSSYFLSWSFLVERITHCTRRVLTGELCLFDFNCSGSGKPIFFVCVKQPCLPTFTCGFFPLYCVFLP